MKTRLLVTIWLAPLAGCTPVVPESKQPTNLSHDDVSFYQYRFEEEPGVWKNATCGYLIRGNSYSWHIPRPEWAISVYEVMDNNTPVVRVDAAAFRVVSNDRKAPVETRPPITHLTFTLKDRGDPLTARIVGPASPLSGEINATLETASAQKLFKAFTWAEPVEVSLTYQDGATEVLEVQSWYVADSDWFGPIPTGGFFNECLKALRPGPAGLRYFVDELGPLPITSRGGLHPPDNHPRPGPIGWWTPPGSFCFGPHGEPGRCELPRQDEGQRPRPDLSPPQ